MTIGKAEILAILMAIRNKQPVVEPAVTWAMDHDYAALSIDGNTLALSKYGDRYLDTGGADTER